MPGVEEIAAILMVTLRRLDVLGVRQLVLFTGRFADEQLAMITRIATNWNTSDGQMIAVARGVNGNANAPFTPDHAGLFETTLLAVFHPQLVEMSWLPAAISSETSEHPYGAQRHHPAHSLHGIFGHDPRAFRVETASGMRCAMANWLANSVDHRV